MHAASSRSRSRSRSSKGGSSFARHCRWDHVHCGEPVRCCCDWWWAWRLHNHRAARPPGGSLYGSAAPSEGVCTLQRLQQDGCSTALYQQPRDAQQCSGWAAAMPWQQLCGVHQPISQRNACVRKHCAAVLLHGSKSEWSVLCACLRQGWLIPDSCTCLLSHMLSHMSLPTRKSALC